MKTFLVPADGQWHTLPGEVTGILASSRNIEIDLLPDWVGKARNTGREPIEIEYSERKPDAVSPIA